MSGGFGIILRGHKSSGNSRVSSVSVSWWVSFPTIVVLFSCLHWYWSYSCTKPANEWKVRKASLMLILVLKLQVDTHSTAIHGAAEVAGSQNTIASVVIEGMVAANGLTHVVWVICPLPSSGDRWFDLRLARAFYRRRLRPSMVSCPFSQLSSATL